MIQILEKSIKTTGKIIVFLEVVKLKNNRFYFFIEPALKRRFGKKLEP